MDACVRLVMFVGRVVGRDFIAKRRAVVSGSENVMEYISWVGCGGGRVDGSRGMPGSVDWGS